VNIVLLSVVGEAYSGRRLDEQKVGYFVPRMGVLGEFIALPVLDSLLQIVWPDFLQKSEER
jgi:hypothetical protein